jgi:hypothetical protein
MILAQICRKTQLAKPVIKSVVGALMQLFVHVSGLDTEAGESSALAHRARGADVSLEILTVVALIAQQQKVSIGPRMLLAALADVADWSSVAGASVRQSAAAQQAAQHTQASLVSSSYFLNCLEQLGKERGYDITALLRSMATTLTTSLKPAPEGEDSQDPLSPSLASRVITHCIARDLFSDAVVTSIVWRVFQGQGQGGGLLRSAVLSSVKQRSAKDRTTSFSEEDDGDRRETLRVLRCVAQRCPVIFDKCVKAAYETLADGEGEADASGTGTDVDDDLQIGPTAAQIAAERAAKAACLRRLLADTFTDTPYRMPGENGLSLLLTLSHASPTVRIQAIETFATAVPLGCASTPDVVVR